MKKLLVLLVVIFAAMSCNFQYEVIKDKKVRKSFIIGRRADITYLQQINKQDSARLSFQPLNKVSSNIGDFSPSSQSLNLIVWNKNNGNIANINIGRYYTRDSFELEGYVTNRNKNEKDYFSKRFSIRDFNKYNIVEQSVKNQFRIIPTGSSIEKRDERNIQLSNLSSFSMADGNITCYKGEYSDSYSKNIEFIAQTDPIPILIVIVGVALASSATTYLIIRDRNSLNNYNIIENAEGYKRCISSNGFPKLELVNFNLFSKDDYRYVGCGR